MTKTLDAEAVSILRKNDLGGFTIPTERLYPYQWNWDSAFCALGFASFDLDRAWTEIETLLDAQWDDGMVPHIIFHRNDPDYFPGPDVWGTNTVPQSTGISQPPVVAIVLAQLIRKSNDEKYLEKLRILFPKVLAWHRWFHCYRDPHSKGVIATVHPWETGRDNSAEWDKPLSKIDTSGIGDYSRRDTSHIDPNMRPLKIEYDQYLSLVKFGREVNWDPERVMRESPFFVADVGMTMILLRADRELLFLAELLGMDDSMQEIRGWIQTSESGVSLLWNENVNAFTALDLRTNEQMEHITSCTFLAWYAGVVNRERTEHLIGHLKRIGELVTYCVPSLDPTHPRFDAIRYHLGPVWLMINYMIAIGLEENGYSEYHNRILENSRELIEKSGFHESYCPITGRNVGGENFSWTAAVWLDWATTSKMIETD